MDLFKHLGDWITDDRLVSNLIALHVLLALILVVSVVLRKLIVHGGSQLAHWTGMHRLDDIGKEAVRHTPRRLVLGDLGPYGRHGSQRRHLPAGGPGHSA